MQRLKKVSREGISKIKVEKDEKEKKKVCQGEPFF